MSLEFGGHFLVKEKKEFSLSKLSHLDLTVMATVATPNLRIFIEFSGHFLPILGDSGIYHVFAIPSNCSTIKYVFL